MAQILPDPSNSPSVCEVCGVGFIASRGRPGKVCSKQCAAEYLTRKWFDSDESPKPGKVYGEWTVLSYSHSENNGVRNRHFFHCRCSCGKIELVTARTLARENLQRCRRCAAIASRPTTHGATRNHSPTPEYKTWSRMHSRCSHPNNPSWDRYGGRGIQVCERWAKFENFLEDMGPKPSPEHSLDRVDGDKNYEPGNCRWATVKEQANNRCFNRFLAFKGRTQTIAQWEQELGFPKTTINQRLDAGWTIERALTQPRRPKNKNGEGRRKP